ncbi:hypothetical protein AVEN_228801-1 [Araneus ventricosus]|uniref:Uncharacterized protein n=1 Tax=Araneus ventricosus TaxID=182803 RepID=A0A4Y2V495_ARAVE|nr:hypothetical protein AVEN_228801-1 [Araneus ventricosus]
MEFLEHGNRKPIIKVENLSNLEQMIRNDVIQKNLKSKPQSTDSNLIHRCESNGKTKDLPTLAPRDEDRNETRIPPCGGTRSMDGRNPYQHLLCQNPNQLLKDTNELLNAQPR